MGSLIEQRSTSLLKMKIVKDVRGQGLIRGVQLCDTADVPKFVELCLHRGLLLVSAGAHTIRLVPPLIISADEVNQGMDIIESVLQNMQSECVCQKSKSI